MPLGFRVQRHHCHLALRTDSSLMSNSSVRLKSCTSSTAPKVQHAAAAPHGTHTPTIPPEATPPTCNVGLSSTKSSALFV